MAEENKKNNTGTKGITVVIALAALIGAMAAIIRPIQQQINTINVGIERIENKIEQRNDKLQIRDKLTTAKEAKLEEKLAWIERLALSWLEYHDKEYYKNALNDKKQGN